MSVRGPSERAPVKPLHLDTDIGTDVDDAGRTRIRPGRGVRVAVDVEAGAFERFLLERLLRLAGTPRP